MDFSNYLLCEVPVMDVDAGHVLRCSIVQVVWISDVVPRKVLNYEFAAGVMSSPKNRIMNAW